MKLRVYETGYGEGGEKEGRRKGEGGGRECVNRIARTRMREWRKNIISAVGACGRDIRQYYCPKET
jgi:hypothetical protein